MKVNLSRSWYEQNISHEDQESGVGGTADGNGHQRAIPSADALLVSESETTYTVKVPAPLTTDAAPNELQNGPPRPASD